MEITIPPALQVDYASKWESNADALWGPRGYENMILRMASQEFSIRNIMLARSELQAMETLVMRYSIMISNAKSQSENTKDKQEMTSIKL